MRLPVRQPIKMPARLHPLYGEYPSSEQRYFRTNSGTTDYVQLASAVTLAGDFEIALKFLPVSGRAHILANSSEDSSARLFYETESNKIELATTAWVARFTVANPVLNKINSLRIGRVSGVWFCNLNGVEYSTEASFSAFTLDRIMSKWMVPTSVPNYAGVIFDLRITSAGVPIHHWPMNEGSGSTHVDVIGGNNGTIINGQPTDWELFERLPGANEWVGGELVTNGDGASAVGWSTAGSNSISVTSVDGELRVNTAGTAGAEQKFATSPGSRYRVSGATRNDSVSTDVRIRFNNHSFVGTIIGEIAQASLGESASGSGVFAALGSQSAVYLRNQSSGLGFFDNISVRRILQEA